MKSRFYDLQHIKAIPIADYLHACGIEPAKGYNGTPSITHPTEKTTMPA